MFDGANEKKATLIPDGENNLSIFLRPSQQLFQSPVFHFAKSYFLLLPRTRKKRGGGKVENAKNKNLLRLTLSAERGDALCGGKGHRSVNEGSTSPPDGSSGLTGSPA